MSSMCQRKTVSPRLESLSCWTSEEISRHKELVDHAKNPQAGDVIYAVFRSDFVLESRVVVAVDAETVVYSSYLGIVPGMKRSVTLTHSSLTSVKRSSYARRFGDSLNTDPRSYYLDRQGPALVAEALAKLMLED